MYIQLSPGWEWRHRRQARSFCIAPAVAKPTWPATELLEFSCLPRLQTWHASRYTKALMLSTSEKAVSDAHALRALWKWYERSGGRLLLGPAVILSTLAASGFPRWRVGVVTGATACAIAMHWLMMWRIERPEAIQRALVLNSFLMIPLS